LKSVFEPTNKTNCISTQCIRNANVTHVTCNALNDYLVFFKIKRIGREICFSAQFFYITPMPLDIRRVPDFGLGTGGGNAEVTDLQEEVTLFEDPFAIGSYKGEGLGGELEGDGLGLTWLEGNLREITQALVVWHDAGDEV